MTQIKNAQKVVLLIIHISISTAIGRRKISLLKAGMRLNHTNPYYSQIKTSPGLFKRSDTQYFDPMSPQQTRGDFGMRNLGYEEYSRRRSLPDCLEYPVYGPNEVDDSEEGIIV